MLPRLLIERPEVGGAISVDVVPGLLPGLLPR